MKQNRADQLRIRLHNSAESVGNLLVEVFHYLALFAIGGMTAWAGTMEALEMIAKGSASIDDILLLFIYLELGAMVGFNLCGDHCLNPTDDCRYFTPQRPKYGCGVYFWSDFIVGHGCIDCALRLSAFSCGTTKQQKQPCQ